MADNDFGPKWVVNSEELGAGIAYLVVIVAAGFILAPAFLLGLLVGSLIWDVKIVKWPMAIAFTIGYFYILKVIYAHAPSSAFGVVCASWALLDYMSAKGDVFNMWIVRKTVKTFKWLFSA